MIQSNELRLGNYIQGSVMDKVTTIKVASIEMDGMVIHGSELPDKIGLIGNLAEKWEPIQITEEWLLNFGFKQESIWVNDHFYSMGNIRVHYDKDEGDFSVIAVSVFNENINNIKYIHELQNLCFAFTHEELELK